MHDSVRRKLGFRSLEVKDGTLVLNGAPFSFKGICYVYDSPATGLVMTSEQIAEDVGLMKAAGCNAVRTHYPMDPAFYEACDAAGLLVWTELPVYCVQTGEDERGTVFSTPHSLALAKQMAAEMVSAAHPHACVAILGAGNECSVSHPEAGPFFEALVAELRTLEPSRLVSYAALYGDVGPLAEWVDVIGVNSYWGWYDKVFARKEPGAERLGMGSPPEPEPIDLSRMRAMIEDVLARRGDLVLLLTEFGADSVPGNHSASRDLWSEEYHAALLTSVFGLAREYPRIGGTFPFTFSD